MMKCLRDNKGEGFPLTVAVTLSLMLILCAGFEYMRLNIIVKEVRDALQMAILSVINDNYDETYHSTREGYSGDYTPYDGGFEPSIDYGEVYKILDTALNLQNNAGYHTKYYGENIGYRVDALSVSVINTDIAPENKSGIRQVKAYASIRLTILLPFCGKTLPPLRLQVKTAAEYIPIF